MDSEIRLSRRSEGEVMRDGSSEPDVDEDFQPVEAMVAMAMAWGVSAEILFGDADT